MRIETGQRMYRVRGPDGLWVKKLGPGVFGWVENEHASMIWKKLHHLKRDMEHIMSEKYLEGLPAEAMHVVEFEVTIQRTRRKHRLTEIDRFYEPDQEEEFDGSPVI